MGARWSSSVYCEFFDWAEIRPFRSVPGHSVVWSAMQHGAQQAPVLDSGTASLRRTIESKQGASSGSASGQASSFEEFYEIADTANFIVANKAKRVALQFPDTLLSDSLRVTVALQARVGSACKVCCLFVVQIRSWLMLAAVRARGHLVRELLRGRGRCAARSC